MERPAYQAFIFESYGFSEETKTLALRYSFDRTVYFEEHYDFNFPITLPADRELLERAFFGLWVMAGISYFKAYLPPKIEFATGGLTKEQADFFNEVYFHGLGQFFVENQLDPHDKIHFIATLPSAPTPLAYAGQGDLVSLGGGKDSLLSTAILEEAGNNFATWELGVYPFFDGLVERIGKPHVAVQRIFDTSVKDQPGAYNGHVPISAIWAFCGVVVALLTGNNQIITSNEHSANEATIENYHGMKINHQYSKTLEFEIAFQNYLHRFISPDLNYFSLLRPLSELKIAELFARRLLERFAGNFSSCNVGNLRFGNEKDHFVWCGDCAKCAFIFLIFAPFVERDKLIALFSKNLFADPTLYPIYNQILGRAEQKPFECVGEINEAKLALWMAWQRGDWPELETLKPESVAYDYAKLAPHAMPHNYYKILLQYLEAA